MTPNDAFDHRALLMLAGQDPMQCHDLAELLKSDPFTTRQSLLRLMKTGEVIEMRKRDGIFYEKAHGGYSPGGGRAA